MNKLNLLLTKKKIQYVILQKGNVVLDENWSSEEEDSIIDYEKQLLQIINNNPVDEINVISAYNWFGMTPIIEQHELAKDIVSLNANINENTHELMLNVNNKYNVQFYFAMPNNTYKILKKSNKPTKFLVSGDRFLNYIEIGKNQKYQLHIHLLHEQVEFFVFFRKKILLYNHLDESSEVDFLYFILFTISKMPFGIQDCDIMLYGEIEAHQTFVSELKKFAAHSQLSKQNIQNNSHILLYHV